MIFVTRLSSQQGRMLPHVQLLVLTMVSLHQKSSKMLAKIPQETYRMIRPTLFLGPAAPGMNAAFANAVQI